MKLLLITVLLFITQVYGYLGERYSPFTVSVDKHQVRRGDTVQISWTLTPGVQFPLYGYASAKTSKTDVGLLAPKSSRTEHYLYLIDSDLSVRDASYTWTVDDDTPTGKYEIGIGFFYHEVSPEIHVI
ncbi:hypothetical protein INT47_000346, partial [Mucor saturninus]